jgi:hypothetical protein
MTSQGNKASRPGSWVIVRAYGDEPVALMLYGLDKERDRAIVGRAGASAPISLPMDHIYRYDLEAFTAMSSAYAAGDVGQLEKLYGEAK